MATHYIENEDSASPYYFDQDNGTSAQATKTTATVTTVSSSDYSPHPTNIPGVHVRSNYDNNDEYEWAQQHQSVAGFTKNVSQQQQQQQQPSVSPIPQVRATVRQVNTHEQPYGSSGQYHHDSRQTTQRSGSPVYYQSPGSVQHSHHDHDSRTDSPNRVRDQHGQVQQTSVRSTSNTMHQQQHDSSPHYYQAPYSPQQVSPQHQHYQYQDQIQQYYSQLTPEQYQQLVRQQQLQRQQQQQQQQPRVEYQQTVITGHVRPIQDPQQYEEYQQRRVYQTISNQDQHYRHPDQHTQSETFYEQQHRAAPQQVSPSPSHKHEQYHQTIVTNVSGQGYQPISPPPPPPPQQQQQQHHHHQQQTQQQHQDEHDYYTAELIQQQQQQQQQQQYEQTAQLEAAHRQQAAPHVVHQEYQQTIQVDQPTKPVGIRGLMSKFTGPTLISTYQSKKKPSKYLIDSNSSYNVPSAEDQTITHTKTQYTVTYSSLPKPTEPPVNSAAYYEMLENEGIINSSPYSGQTGAPQHIQGPAPGFGALRNRFKSNASEENNSGQEQKRFYHSNSGNSSLLMLRDQYLNRAQEANQTPDNSSLQNIQTVTRTVITETYQTTVPTTSVEPAATQQEEVQPQSQSVEDTAVSSEAAVADGNSLSGASSLDHDTTLNNTDAEPTVVSS